MACLNIVRLAEFETFVRLSPRESKSGAYLGIGVGHFYAQRGEKDRMHKLLRSCGICSFSKRWRQGCAALRCCRMRATLA
jgi:hypothetical protein